MEFSSNAFLSLMHNAALLLAAAFLFDIFASRWRIGQLYILQKVFVGAILGTIGLVVMMTPWTLMA